jgi:hypothetical protein
MSKHNKKRNVGIVYEQLVAVVSQATVEGNQAKANNALRIIKKYFAPGTELYREFRLINSLVKTHVGSDALASRILDETKRAAIAYDVSKLQSEKSALIGDINRTFQKESFYRTPVKNYKVFATIHTLLEDWRSNAPDISRRLQYETVLHGWLLQEKNEPQFDGLKTVGVNDLTVKIMRESFNKKFGNSLNESQRKLLQTIAFGGKSASLVAEMKDQRDAAIKSLQSYKAQCDSRIVEQKIPGVIQVLESLNPEDTSDQNVARFMTVSQLCDELMEKKND